MMRKRQFVKVASFLREEVRDVATVPEQLATRLDIVARYSAINYFPITRLLIKATLTFLSRRTRGSAVCRVLGCSAGRSEQ